MSKRAQEQERAAIPSERYNWCALAHNSKPARAQAHPGRRARACILHSRGRGGEQRDNEGSFEAPNWGGKRPFAVGMGREGLEGEGSRHIPLTTVNRATRLSATVPLDACTGSQRRPARLGWSVGRTARRVIRRRGVKSGSHGLTWGGCQVRAVELHTADGREDEARSHNTPPSDRRKEGKGGKISNTTQNTHTPTECGQWRRGGNKGKDEGRMGICLGKAPVTGRRYDGWCDVGSTGPGDRRGSVTEWIGLADNRVWIYWACPAKQSSVKLGFCVGIGFLDPADPQSLVCLARIYTLGRLGHFYFPLKGWTRRNAVKKKETKGQKSNIISQKMNTQMNT